ncbi:MAG: NAD(P) transhydrogenase subunit alpha [Planctomycetes bacterium]|nr:NAD(P) transhydrogenase subunit alpha [Planctomycetota bacterium]
MKLFVMKEAASEETRVPMLPAEAGKLVQLGADVVVEAGIGKSIHVPDEAYTEVGSTVTKGRVTALKEADLVLRMNVPEPGELSGLKKGAVHVSNLDPFNNREVVKALADAGVSGISLEMIPRTTIAQKMDVLSSQANLAGYVAVVLAAERQQKIFPMMMTPSGTISPARVFIIGAGVAGLQAIATAKRLGARVEAFDVRPEAQEQILSLGAKPLTIDLGETGKTKDGYAKQLTDEQIQIQREAMAKQCGLSDVVITTAKVFGREAPLIVTNEMLDAMQPGSLVVDMAVETGGNVEASKLGKEVTRKGVTIIGLPELQRRVPVPASQMFSSNLCHLVTHFWDKEAKQFVLNQDDEIIQGCLLTHDGAIVHPMLKSTSE